MTPPPPGAPLWSRALPGLALEAAGRCRLGRQGGRDLVLDGLERRADPVAQSREPGRGARSAGARTASFVDQVDVRSSGTCEGEGKRLVCRSASPRIMAAVTATLSERRPAPHGNDERASAAAWTSSGTPADSRPTRMTSSRRRRNPRKAPHPWWSRARGDRPRRDTPRRRARRCGG